MLLKVLLIALGVLFDAQLSLCAPEDDIRDFKDQDQKELLLWEPPEQLQREFPYFMTGFDDEGSPIWVAEMGKWDVKKMVDNGRRAVRDYKLYVLQFLARCIDSVKILSTPEEPIDGFNLIVDMEGYGSRQIASPSAVSLQLWATRQFEQAFSKSIKQAFVLNTGFAFSTMWNLMKPILGPNTYKVEILGSNKGRWIPQLLRSYPEDQLPAWMGGTQDPENILTYG